MRALEPNYKILSVSLFSSSKRHEMLILVKAEAYGRIEDEHLGKTGCIVTTFNNVVKHCQGQRNLKSPLLLGQTRLPLYIVPHILLLRFVIY